MPAWTAVVFCMNSPGKRRTGVRTVALILLRAVAVVLTVYSVGLVFTSNFNMGNLLVWLLTATVDCYTVWHQPINRWFSSGAGRVVGILLLIGVLVYACILGFVSVSGYTNSATGREQAIVVLGAGLRGDRPSLLLRYRLDKAYAYAVQHPDMLIITSGGQGRDEWVPEGQAMRDYLIRKGLDPDRILAETKSTSTEENFAFSRQILMDQGLPEDMSIVYVTNAFHCYRAGEYARRAGFVDPHALPAGISILSVLPCYLREVLAVLYYWVFKSSESGLMHSMVGILSLNKKFFYKS